MVERYFMEEIFKLEDALTVIHNRKSVRKYTDKPVEKETLHVLFKAAMAACTSADKRPWSFIGITEKTKLFALAEVLKYGKMLKDAGAAIVVCGTPQQASPDLANEFWVQDCAAATHNILIAAEAVKLGAVWIGIYPMTDRIFHLRSILQIPEEIFPFSIVSLGYPLGVEKPRNKYDETKIHWNKW